MKHCKPACPLGPKNSEVGELWRCAPEYSCRDWGFFLRPQLEWSRAACWRDPSSSLSSDLLQKPKEGGEVHLQLRRHYLRSIHLRKIAICFISCVIYNNSQESSRWERFASVFLLTQSSLQWDAFWNTEGLVLACFPFFFGFPRDSSNDLQSL